MCIDVRGQLVRVTFSPALWSPGLNLDVRLVDKSVPPRVPSLASAVARSNPQSHSSSLQLSHCCRYAKPYVVPYHRDSTCIRTRACKFSESVCSCFQGCYWRTKVVLRLMLTLPLQPLTLWESPHFEWLGSTTGPSVPAPPLRVPMLAPALWMLRSIPALLRLLPPG